jgi:hypothetical protein
MKMSDRTKKLLAFAKSDLDQSRIDLSRFDSAQKADLESFKKAVTKSEELEKYKKEQRQQRIRFIEAAAKKDILTITPDLIEARQAATGIAIGSKFKKTYGENAPILTVTNIVVVAGTYVIIVEDKKEKIFNTEQGLVNTQLGFQDVVDIGSDPSPWIKPGGDTKYLYLHLYTQLKK